MAATAHGFFNNGFRVSLLCFGVRVDSGKLTTIEPLIATPIRPAQPSSGLNPTGNPDIKRLNIPSPTESNATNPITPAMRKLVKVRMSVVTIRTNSTGA